MPERPTPGQESSADIREREHGPVPTETLEWAARLVDAWAAEDGGRDRRTG